MASVTALRFRRRLPVLGRRGAFRLHASTLVALLAASSAPTPVYALYQAAWHFSAMTLTVVFSAYVLALLVALLTAGTLSDHLAGARSSPGRCWLRPSRWPSPPPRRGCRS
ncbi:hypothetical protein SLAVM298S_03846 [Streptomyces lavendulae subsp. lavendulae]